MSRRIASISPAYFDELYAENPDPWRFATSDYECKKYAATLGALPPRSFAAGLEIGCSIGVLTSQLARHCADFLALDVAEAALAQARLANPGVRFARAVIPEQWPPGKFDLIVFSEVLYFLDAADIAATAQLAVSALKPGGCILMVHYLGETDYPVSGNAAAEKFIAAAGLNPDFQQQNLDYRIDRLGHPCVELGATTTADPPS